MAVTHSLPCLHPPGVGFDFLLEIHDLRGTCFEVGACRDRQVRTPPPLSLPTGMLPSDRGAHEGRGPIFAFLGRGFTAGAARAAGSASDVP
jgi:hypothetical protein